MRTQLRHLWREVDNRLGDTPAPPLLSVSQTLGVVRRELISDKPPRADSFDKYKICEAGDVVLNRFNAYRGSLGISNERGIVSPDYLVLRANRNSHPKFLDFLLRSEDLSSFMKSTMGGLGASDPDVSGFSRIDVGSLGQYSVPTLDFQKQRAIAEFLDRETAQIADLIGKQERLIELLTEKRQAMITHAVTKGLDPTAPTRPSGVPWQGPVPEHWTVQPLKNLIRMQTGVTLGKDFSEVETETYPYLRVANVQIGYVDLNEVKEIDLPKDVATTSMLRAGDVLMTEGGDRDKLARGCIWEAPIAPCVHQNHIFAVRTGDELLNKFLVLALDADPARAYFYLTGKQSTNLASTNSTTVKNFRFGVPPMVEQHRIVDHLGLKTRLIDDLVDKANAVISTLKERRSALISAAVTGKIDVREGVA